MAQHFVTKLDFTRVGLAGRKEELQTLQNAYERSLQNNQVETVLIQGTAGCGKSRLAESFLEEEESKVLSGRGKFHKNSSVQEPFGAIREAFESLVQHVLTSGFIRKEEWNKRIRESLGSEIYILANLIPEYVETRSNTEGGGGGDTQGSLSTTDVDKLERVARKFIRTVTSLEHPVSIFLDDLQWADPDSVRLLETILLDEEPKQLFFLGTHRPLNGEGSDPLAFLKKKVSASSSCQSTTIQLNNLDLMEVSQILSNLLQRDQEQVQDLAELVLRKTGGNPFFVVQYLRVLSTKGLLYCSLSSFRLEYNVDTILARTDISQNVVDVIAEKISDCECILRLALTTAALCGLPRIETNTLFFVIQAIEEQNSNLRRVYQSEEELESVLDEATVEGFLEKLSKGTYKFAHDQIVTGALSLLPSADERQALHLVIGKRLRELSISNSESSPQGSAERFLLLAAFHMNRAAELISIPNEKAELAKLNMEAAELAMQRISFFPAVDYLEAGLSLLEENRDTCWVDQYDLMIKFNTELARMRFSCGQMDLAKEPIDIVLKNAHTFAEKIGVYCTKLSLLIHENRHDEAFRTLQHVLDELDVPVPSRFHRYHSERKFRRIDQLIKNKSDKDLLALPTMTDKRQLITLQFTWKLGEFSCMTRNVFLDRVACLILMEITLEHGHSLFSCSAFSTYACALSARSKIDDSVRFAKLALEFIKGEATDQHAFSIAMVYFFCLHWVKPYHECIEPLLESYSISTKLGLDEHRIYSCGHYLMLYFCCGLRLGPMESDANTFAQVLKDYGLKKHHSFILPYWQLAQNLMGKAKDPLVLTGEATDQKQYLKELESSDNKLALESFAIARMFAAFYFNDLDIAEEQVKNIPDARMAGSAMLPVRFLFEGLIAIARARQTGSIVRKHRCLTKAKKLIRTFDSWLSQGAVNCHHMMLMLRAELGSLDKKRVGLHTTQRAYDDAITAATKLGFLHHAALSNELAGRFFLECDETLATVYLSRSRDLYRQWEAHAKVNQLEAKFSFLETSDSDNGTSVRARIRLSALSNDRHKMLNLDDDP